MYNLKTPNSVNVIGGRSARSSPFLPPFVPFKWTYGHERGDGGSCMRHHHMANNRHTALCCKLGFHPPPPPLPHSLPLSLVIIESAQPILLQSRSTTKSCTLCGYLLLPFPLCFFVLCSWNGLIFCYFFYVFCPSKYWTRLTLIAKQIV